MADLRAGPDAASIAANASATSGSVGLAVGQRRMAGRRQDVGDRDAEVGRAVVRLAERRPFDDARSVTVVAIADQPRPVARWSASANGRPVRKIAAIGSSSGDRVRR